MADTTSITRVFVKGDEKKHSIVYRETAADPSTLAEGEFAGEILRSPYVTRASLAALGNPERVEITIKAL